MLYCDWKEVNGWLAAWVDEVRQIASPQTTYAGRPLREVADNIEDLMVQVMNTECRAENGEMADECLSMIRQRLERIGCCHPPETHASTPPMSYDDWISCAVIKREKRIAELEAENAWLAKELAEKTDILKRGGV